MSTEKIKFLKYSLSFCVFLGCILFVAEKSFSFFASNSNNAQVGKVNLVMSHSIDPQILILGSSVSEVGFNSLIIEEKTNKDAYNLALDGTPILRSEYLIDEFLSYSKNCKYIIIGTAFFSLGEIKKIHAPERILAHKSNAYVKENLKKWYPKLYHKLSFMPFYSFILSNQIYYKNALIGLKNIYNKKNIENDPLKGFVPHYENYKDTRGTVNSQKITFSKESIKNFKKILKKIHLKGITPILSINPMHKNGQISFENYTNYSSILKQIAKETNTRIIDFSNSDITSEENYFYNNGHLNSKGADLFTNAICDSLANLK